MNTHTPTTLATHLAGDIDTALWTPRGAVVRAVVSVVQHQFHLAGHAHDRLVLHHRLEQLPVRVLHRGVEMVLKKRTVVVMASG